VWDYGWRGFSCRSFSSTSSTPRRWVLHPGPTLDAGPIVYKESIDLLRIALRIMKSGFCGKSFLPNLAQIIQIQPKMANFWQFHGSAHEGRPFGAHLRNESETKASPNGPPHLHTQHRSSSCVQAPNLNAVTSSTCILDAFLTRVRNASRSERENLWTQHNLNLLTNQYQHRIPLLSLTKG
jgi:hypothetical protein